MNRVFLSTISILYCSGLSIIYIILAQFSFPSQYASVEKNGERHMSPEDFVSKFLHAQTDIRLSKEGTVLLAGVLDQTKDGLVFISIAAVKSLCCT